MAGVTVGRRRGVGLTHVLLVDLHFGLAAGFEVVDSILHLEDLLVASVEVGLTDLLRRNDDGFRLVDGLGLRVGINSTGTRIVVRCPVRLVLLHLPVGHVR